MKNLKQKLVLGAVVFSLAASMVMPATAVAAPKEKTEVTQIKKEKKEKPVAQKVSKVTCTAAGKLNISFKNKVTYTDAVSAVVTDAQGTEIACKIAKKNKNMMSVSVSGLVKGATYTVKVEGIKAQNTEEAVTVEKTFVAKGMKTAVKPSKVIVSGKNTVTIKLQSAGYYKDATVSVVAEDGTELDAKIVKKAKGNIKVSVTGMEKGKKYTVTVNGVKTKKEKNFSSITKSFTAK